MSDRRTFLGNAAAAAVMAKISSLRSFGVATDGPETIDPAMSDRRKAGLRGPVKQYTEETITPGAQGYPEMRLSQTTEYDPDGRLLATRTNQTDGTEWMTTQTYDADGRLVKTISGKMGEPRAETLYTYDQAGRLLAITNNPGKGGRTDFHYDEQGRKTTTQSFDPETLKRAQSSMFTGSSWDAAATAGIGVPVGGNITTSYNGNDLPTEAQIRDSEGRIRSRLVRTYDANGRLVEEEPFQENPALFFADRFAAEGQPQPTAAQLQAMNTAMKSLLRGRSGSGTSYIYDEQGRITKIHDRNFMFDKVTIITYNERGDKSEEHETLTGNSSAPVGTAFSVDENGTLIPDKRATGPTESPGSPDLSREEEVRYAYQYDSYGNWTGQTVNYSSSPDGPSYVCHRNLTYY